MLPNTFMNIKNEIEHICQNRTENNGEDIKLAIQLMSTLIPEKCLYVYSDRVQWFKDFQYVVYPRDVKNIYYVEQFAGISDAHLVILNGNWILRTHKERQNYDDFMRYIKSRRNITVWQIEHWR